MKTEDKRRTKRGGKERREGSRGSVRERNNHKRLKVGLRRRSKTSNRDPGKGRVQG